MESKIDKKFDAVKMARKIKNKLDIKLSKMSKEEMIDFFRKQRAKTNRIKPSA